MGIVHFLVFVVLVVLACAAAVWIIDYLAPNHPIMIDRGIWVLAVVVILWMLATAMGLLSHDVPIPHVT